MGWFQRNGNRVHAEGSFAAALVRRGFEPCDEPDDRTFEDAPEHGVSFDVDTRVHADLSDDERADVDTAVREEG